MTKEEFLNLEGIERCRIVRRAFNSNKKDIVKKLASWEGEKLATMGFERVPHWGWVKTQELPEMCLNRTTGAIMADSVVVVHDNYKNRDVQCYVCKGHTNWLEKKRREEDIKRGFSSVSFNYDQSIIGDVM